LPSSAIFGIFSVPRERYRKKEKGRRKREEIFMINIFGIEVSTQKVKVTKDQGKIIEPLVHFDPLCFCPFELKLWKKSTT